MNVKNFENQRWAKDDQKVFFRHKAAFSLVNDGAVLDLGCGDGLLLSMLRQKGIGGKGLDLSLKGVEKARSKGIDARVFDFGGGEPLPFEDGSFDHTIMLDVLEHLYDPLSLLKEAGRVSRKSIIVGVPNFSSLPARIQVALGRVPENNRPNKGHIYWFNYHVLRKMAGAAGLSMETCMTNTMFSNTPLLRNIMKLCASAWPSLFALSFVAKLNKS